MGPERGNRRCRPRVAARRRGSDPPCLVDDGDIPVASFDVPSPAARSFTVEAPGPTRFLVRATTELGTTGEPAKRRWKLKRKRR